MKQFAVGDLAVVECPGSVLALGFHPEGELIQEIDHNREQVRLIDGWYLFKHIRPLAPLSFIRMRYEEQLAFKNNALTKVYYSEERRREVLESIEVITLRFEKLLQRLDKNNQSESIDTNPHAP